EKAGALLTAEPLWSVYQPNSPTYWDTGEVGHNPLISLQFANPLFFLGTVALIGVGVWQRWLTSSEVALAVPLLLIPYLSRSYEMGMHGMGRFAAVVLPAYLVLGKCLCRLPKPLAAAVLALCGFLLGTYSALFAAGY